MTPNRHHVDFKDKRAHVGRRLEPRGRCSVVTHCSVSLKHIFTVHAQLKFPTCIYFLCPCHQHPLRAAAGGGRAPGMAGRRG